MSTVTIAAVIREHGLTSVQIESDDPTIEQEFKEINKEDPQFIADCLANCINGVLVRHRKSKNPVIETPDGIKPEEN